MFANQYAYMIKKITIILSFFLYTSLAFAQQAPQYTMYMLNNHAFNPGYTGLDESLSFTGVYRKQWVGLLNSPESQQINAHMPFYFLKGGIGINVGNDLVGAERKTNAALSYSYWIPINKKSLFSIGLEAGISQHSIDGNLLRTPEGTFIEGLYTDHNDRFLPSGNVSASSPIVNLGVFYQNERINAGISISNLTEPTTSLELGTQRTDILINRNYFLTLGLNFEIGSNWTVFPSILAKSDLIQTETHFSTIIRYNDNIFGGASFRGYNSTTVDALAILAGLKLNEKVTLAYSYDFTLSVLNVVSRGTHEILLNYNLNRPIGKGLLPKIIYNPRYE